jgi:high-affinity nickel-transport protein
MLLLGLRHGLDVDHISAIDSLVRLHNASKKARWVGTGFSTGHMISILLEMILVIYAVGSFLKSDNFTLLSGLLGAAVLGLIGTVNMYSMRKWGRSGIAILAGKMLLRTERVGPYGSAFITGMVFGLGFDTATQISAISVSAVASATQGIQVALSLVAFFGLGMVTMDTLNSVILRSAFWKIFQTKAFRYMAYGLSAVAIGIACVNGIGHIVSVVSIPEWSGPVLAAAVISSSFSYAYFVKKKGIVDPVAR